jgi:hypothetical protein
LFIVHVHSAAKSARAVLCASLACLLCTFAFGEEPKDDRLRDAIANCRSYNAHPKLDAIRSRIPFDGNEPTKVMRTYEKKPNAAERAALEVYKEVQLACAAELAKAESPTDAKAQDEIIAAYKLWIAERVDPLLTGRITFAEYLRREDKRNADAKAAFKRANSFRAETERWLGGGSPDARSSSFWPEFTRDALAIAERVDSGLIPREEGSRLLEERRHRFNNDLATASQVTLNCAYQGSDGRRMDGPVVIDYMRQQVNGFSAQFSDTMIQWETSSSDGRIKYTNTLNRLSGFTSIGSGEFPTLFTGQCSTAKRQF